MKSFFPLYPNSHSIFMYVFNPNPIQVVRDEEVLTLGLQAQHEWVSFNLKGYCLLSEVDTVEWPWVTTNAI